jgi:membrane dipeptidase
VTDTTVTRVSLDRKKFEPFRAPIEGELRRLAEAEFARIAAVVEHEGLFFVKRRDDLTLVRERGPSVIVACEGADFLEGRLDGLDEAHALHGLRNLQLTHYRVNELGDIQTEPPVHGGLTEFGADVIRRCQRLGIVADVAHGTFDLVKMAASVATKPLVLSHTSLAAFPDARSRQITADHARVVGETGGVIGVWPSAGVFASLDSMALGAKRLADIVGVDHVGLGTDMLGFISTPVLNRYEQLPSYGESLSRAGFDPSEVAKVLGGNAVRVLAATLSPTATESADTGPRRPALRSPSANLSSGAGSA